MIKRVFNVFRGFIGLFVSGMERRNPEALLEIEKETFASRSPSTIRGWRNTPACANGS